MLFVDVKDKAGAYTAYLTATSTVGESSETRVMMVETGESRSDAAKMLLVRVQRACAEQLLRSATMQLV